MTSKTFRVGALTIASLVIAAPAFADDQACIKSYEQTQVLRKGTKLREAREEAGKCAESSCPAVLAKDCTKWMAELDDILPTVILEAKTGTGEPIANAKVTIDGKKTIDKIDDKPVQLDPGKHTFHFEAEGKAIDQEAALSEKEKGHKVTATFGSAKVAEASTSGAEPSSVPIAAWVFGGVGIVGLGLGTVFAIVGSGKESDLDACKPNCSSDAVNSASSSFAIADIAFAAGAVSLIAGGYLFLTRPSASSPHVTARGVTFRF